MANTQSVTVNGVTVTINLEDVAVIGAETAISIILALSPLGIIALPAWALVILPLVKTELPLAEALLKEVAIALEANQEPKAILDYLHTAMTNWQTNGYANTGAVWPQV